MRTDLEIQRDVEQTLQWDPRLMHEHAAVTVHEGVVGLVGRVNSFVDRWRAERLAARVKGVRGLANDLEVRLPPSLRRDDDVILFAARQALDWDLMVPHQARAVVVDGWLTLTGEVIWHFQREAAERAVRHLVGVAGLTNSITLRVPPTSADVKRKVVNALERDAAIDDSRITVEVQGDRATLRGSVRSFIERSDAERAAANTPGICGVDNRLAVDPNLYAPA